MKKIILFALLGLGSLTAFSQQLPQKPEKVYNFTFQFKESEVNNVYSALTTLLKAAPTSTTAIANDVTQSGSIVSTLLLKQIEDQYRAQSQPVAHVEVSKETVKNPKTK
jgi:hypothetical protein